MDISKVDINYIEIFDSSYYVAKEIFEKGLAATSARLKKKIRKKIEQCYIGNEVYPKRVMCFIDKTVCDDDFFKFIKTCHDYIQEHGTWQRQRYEKAAVDFPEEVKHTVWTMLERGFLYGTICKIGEDAQIIVENGSAYRRTLILKNATYLPEGEYDCLSFEDGNLIRTEDEYRLVGMAENWEADTQFPFAIRFTDAKVDITLLKADAQGMGNAPWMYLQMMVTDILDKCSLPGDYLNEKEKKVLPLVAEIGKLTFWSRAQKKFQDKGFPRLKSYILKGGYPELIPLLERYEEKKLSDEKLESRLNRQKYEPLWRELYQILKDTQGGYEAEADVYCEPQKLRKVRGEIQTLVEEWGYSGEYPDFVKRGSVRGIRVVNSYDMSYFISHEKNVVYHIHCIETHPEENLRIEFICGTELLRKNEEAGDIYSCMFRANGRRLFKSFSYEISGVNDEDDMWRSELKQYVNIAVKMAQLDNLTKEERHKIYPFDVSYGQLFLLTFGLMGGLYSLFMTIGFLLLAILSCLIVGQPQSIPLMLAEFPWLFVFGGCWVLFGGAMGIVTILAAKK